MMSAPSMGERSMYLLRKSPITSKCRKVRRLQHPLSCTNPKAAAQEHTLNFTQEVLGHGREEQVYERDEDARDR